MWLTILGIAWKAWGWVRDPANRRMLVCALCAFVAVVLLYAAWSHGRTGERTRIEIETARNAERVRERANEAARDAERDGAVDRLREHRF